MEIKAQKFDEAALLSIAGDFDARTAPLAHAKLDELLAQMQTRFVINVAGLEIVTSTAISFLVDAAKRSRKLGGDAVLSESPRLLVSSLKSLSVGDYFRMFDSDDAALSHFRELAAHADDPAPPSDEPAGKRPPWWRFGR